MSTFGGAGIMLGSWGENDWVLSGNARWFALACVLLVVVVALYYVFTYIIDALNKDKKQGMAGVVPINARTWTNQVSDQIGLVGVQADANAIAAQDDMLSAMSRGDAVKQGLMGGRGYDMPSFWSADAVNRESQQQRFNIKDGDVQGFRVNKALQGLSGGGAEAPLSDAKLQGTLLGQSQLQY